MKVQVILVSAILLVSSCGERANQPKEASEPTKLIENFFSNYRQSGPRNALGGLLPTNKYISAQDADSIGVKLERLATDLGEFQGYEKITETTYGKSIRQLVYVVKYSRQPIRFNFKFYQPGNGWRIQNFAYEVEFLDELDETSRAIRLKENYQD